MEVCTILTKIGTTDEGFSQFTLLFQDQHGGLQFLDRASGEFIDAAPKDGVLYMNIGDMFQRVSNGKPLPS